MVVHGIPYAYDWRDLKDMFNDEFAVDRADIVTGQDGRSKVGCFRVIPCILVLSRVRLASVSCYPAALHISLLTCDCLFSA